MAEIVVNLVDHPLQAGLASHRKPMDQIARLAGIGEQQNQRRADAKSTDARLVGERFVAERPWSDDRPETLVVCCSDGRWHGQVEEFVRGQVSERADMYALPGGPAGFNLWSSSFDEAKVAERAFRFLAEHHELESVWLLAHQDCAYYRARYHPLDEQFVLRRQLEDLARAKDLISQWSPNLLVRRVFVARENGRVVFTTITDEWE